MSTLEQLHAMVGNNENILWSGKPMKKCFLLEAVFNRLLPFALVWLLLDGFFISMLFFSDNGQAVAEFPLAQWGVLAFFTLHLMPVWIYLGGILFATLRYKNAAFLLTDKGIYISSGVFSLNFNHKPFMEISRVNLHRGIIDRMLGVGDVVISTSDNLDGAPKFVQDLASGLPRQQLNTTLSIYDIPDYQHVYNLVKQLQQDIYSDVQYPNDLRPKENHGYHTAYIPLENIK